MFIDHKMDIGRLFEATVCRRSNRHNAGTIACQSAAFDARLLTIHFRERPLLRTFSLAANGRMRSKAGCGLETQIRLIRTRCRLSGRG